MLNIPLHKAYSLCYQFIAQLDKVVDNKESRYSSSTQRTRRAAQQKLYVIDNKPCLRDNVHRNEKVPPFRVGLTLIYWWWQQKLIQTYIMPSSMICIKARLSFKTFRAQQLGKRTGGLMPSKLWIPSAEVGKASSDSDARKKQKTKEGNTRNLDSMWKRIREVVRPTTCRKQCRIDWQCE